MKTMRRVNCITELELYLNANANGTNTDLEIICQVCEDKKLTISTRIHSTLVEKDTTIPVQPLDELVSLTVHGFERTVIFPCGHFFGDRCVREKLLEEGGLTCPSCGFQMAYSNCGHAIVPAIIPASGAGCIRDTFPLTMPEGGPAPSHCKECRWRAIQGRLRYALSPDCVVCARMARAGVLSEDDSAEHDAHHTRHVQGGIKDALGEIMMLAHPDFITRDTKESARKAAGERDRRDAHGALLFAMVLTELEDTVWHRTPTRWLSEERERIHEAGVRHIECYLLRLVMDPGRDPERNCRRMW
ncbi:putative phosphatidylethanolamine-binding protein [Rosellinia necatrix]|uniref:Putative phosphatidylethanolamine-binding protein n=1 Tax=Rosellinia necatrix TaxID=77044 RepID=A0A1S8A890_ROSNE|nr:putative phosphatidylethanolamine-binding protein [Rosellinia necatrix]